MFRIFSKVKRRRRRISQPLKKKKGWLDGIVLKIQRTNKRRLKQKVRTGEAKKSVNRFFDYRTLIQSRVFNAILVLIVIYMAFLTGREALANFYQSKQLYKIESDNNYIAQKNQQSAYLLEYYKTETYAELEARKHLNLKKKDENVAVAAVDMVDAQLNDSEIETNRQAKPNYKKWWDFLFVDYGQISNK